MIDSQILHIPTTIGSYILFNSIGHGSSSIVKIAQHIKTKEYYACKIIPKFKINSSFMMERLESEVRVNQQIHHPGIVEMFDLMKDENNYYIILEYCPGGTLFDKIIQNIRLSEYESKTYFHQIFEVIRYIQSLKITHRDIKPENILFGKNGKIKLSDFGLSKFTGENNLVKTMCGSPCYTSPDILQQKPYDGKKSDMWSLGVLLYVSVTGQIPWENGNQIQIFKQILRCDYHIPEYLSHDCQDLIHGLMNKDSKERLTPEECLNHQWLKNIKNQYNKDDTIYGAVSLRMVDKFFAKDVKVGNLRKAGVQRNNSTEMVSFSTALKELSPKADHKKKSILTFSSDSFEYDPKEDEKSVTNISTQQSAIKLRNVNKANKITTNWSNKIRINPVSESHRPRKRVSLQGNPYLSFKKRYHKINHDEKGNGE